MASLSVFTAISVPSTEMGVNILNMLGTLFSDSASLISTK